MTARKQLTNKERVQRKYPSAYAVYFYWESHWYVYSREKVKLGHGPTPALAWAAAARVM